MKQIHEGEIFEVIPQAGGIVYSFPKSANDNGEVLVRFKFYSFENDTTTDIEPNVYLLAKYGANYQAALPFCENFILTRALPLNDNAILLCEPNGKSVLLDSKGVVTWTGEIKYHGKTPTDFAMDGNNIWACFDSLDAVIRLNPKTLREDLRLGGKGSIISVPKSIYIEEGAAYISAAKSKKLLKIDLKSFDTEDTYYFEEPILSYNKVGIYEFAHLKSGLYML